ncbi:hypothetical protein D9M70_442890 [compost metagenome]
MTIADLGALSPPRSRRDPGIDARERVKARAAKVKTVMMRTYLLVTLMLFTAVGGAGYYGHQQYLASGVRYTDYRPCSYVDEKHGIEITGRRSYSYKQHSILGFQFRDMRKVDEQTQIDVRGNSITIVGLTTEGWWASYVDEGERGIEILKPASSYVFTTLKKAAVVDYNSFCR